MYYGERLNSISHLVGAVFALVGLGALLTTSIQSGDPWRISKVLDHISIYLLIAGSYTPFILVLMRTTTGWTILFLVWALALLGILSEIFLRGTAVKVVQMLLYLGMGWACSIDLQGLKESLDPAGYGWLLGGGLAYTGGVVFYLLDKMDALDHAHGIWHFFVLMGSLCHFIAIMGYV